MNPLIKYILPALITLFIGGLLFGLGLQMIFYGVIFWSLGPSDPTPLITIQWWGVTATGCAFLLTGLGLFLLGTSLRHTHPTKQ